MVPYLAKSAAFLAKRLRPYTDGPHCREKHVLTVGSIGRPPQLRFRRARIFGSNGVSRKPPSYYPSTAWGPADTLGLVRRANRKDAYNALRYEFLAGGFAGSSIRIESTGHPANVDKVKTTRANVSYHSYALRVIEVPCGLLVKVALIRV